jgi:DNA-cytosine methyltransferase
LQELAIRTLCTSVAKYFKLAAFFDVMADLHRGPPLRVATDCSGMGTVLIVLQSLGWAFEHIWASEPQLAAQKMLQLHGKPAYLFEHIEDHRGLVLPHVDLYVSGFPCPPFSRAGLRKGFDAPGGTVFEDVYRVLTISRPSIFILENVEGLLTINRGACVAHIMSTLHSLPGYEVHYKILNTKDFGVPQNRARCYFVGLRRACLRPNLFFWPHERPLVPIDSLLDPRLLRPSWADLPPRTSQTARSNVIQFLAKIENSGRDPFWETWVVECDSSADHGAKAWQGLSPCLTRSRAKGHWLTSRGRRMSTAEFLRLQGFSGDLRHDGISERQLREMVGNAMSANVLKELLKQVLSLLPTDVLG